MRRLPAALTVLSLSLFIAACSSDRETTAPRSVAPRSAPSAVTYLTLTCDFPTLNQDAKKYFTAKDQVFTMIADMKTAYKTSAAAATPKGFEILAYLADYRRAHQQIGTSTDGGKVITDVVACMAVGPVPDTFMPDKALAAGIVEVRTGGTDGSTPDPALAYLSPTAGSTIPADPEWGVERRTLTSIWPYVVPSTAPSNRFLIYGYQNTSDVLTGGFELSTLPVPDRTQSEYVDIKSNPLTVGVCSTSTPAFKTARLLIHNSTDILNLQQPRFCQTSTLLNVAPKSWFASLSGRVLGLFRPTLLFAQYDETYIGGLPSGWSPFTLQDFIATDITLSFYTQPTDSYTSATETIVVEATTTDTMPPMNVRLTIAGNNGTPAYFLDANGNPVSYLDAPLQYDTTLQKWLATFNNVGWTKAGGYTLNATGYIGGGTVSTAGVISNLFTVQNK